MATNRITIRVPEGLTVRLRNRSKAQGATESELVREAIESYLARSGKERSAYDFAADAGIVGSDKNSPKDLSTNRHHFKGFGKSR